MGAKAREQLLLLKEQLGKVILGKPEVLDRLLIALEDGSHAAGTTLQGFTSGYRDWDRLGPGFLQGGLYVLAGRPGMGKTSLALDITRHVVAEVRGDRLLLHGYP